MNNENAVNQQHSQPPSLMHNETALRTTEGSSMAVLRQGQEVQAALVIAKQFPRDVGRIIESIKVMCARPKLAEVALYEYSRGGVPITGPSIRLAEAIAQNYGNLEFGFREINRDIGNDGVGFSEIMAYCWDMQSNTRRTLNFRVRHWRDTRKGGYALTDERDIYELMANMAQRRVRACIIAVVPGDIFDEAIAQSEDTMKQTADTSPENLKRIIAVFAEYGVKQSQIEERIQRKLEAITPAQVVQLKKIYSSLKDGMSKPEDWFKPAEVARSATSEPIDPFKGQSKPQEQNKPPFETETKPEPETIDELF